MEVESVALRNQVFGDADTTFVSTTGQTEASGKTGVGRFGADQWKLGQAFTTGSDAVTLSEVDVQLHDVDTGAGVKVSIWSTTDDTAPTLSRATVIGNDVTLVYNEALDTTSTPATAAFAVTVAGSARSIASGGVSVRGPAVVLTLSGSAITSGQAVVVTYTVPTTNPIRDAAENNAAALTSQAVTLGETLVANTGQTTGSNLGVGEDGSANHWSQAVAFTTGPNAGTLYEVEVTLEGVPTGAGMKASVWSATSAGLPDSKLYDLTNPATVTANAANTFLAPGNSTLAANTTYAVVFENTATGSVKRYFVAGTAARDEDAGASRGFSIADKRAVRNGTGAWSQVGNPVSPIPKIAVKGTAPDVTGPVVLDLTVDGNTVTLHYNEPLDDGSTPSNADFTATVAGAAKTIEVTVTVSGSQVTLLLSGAPVTSGQRVVLSYTKGTNPIRDVAENDAVALTNVPVRHIVAVVSNTGQTPDASFLFVGETGGVHWSQALAFTTGSRGTTFGGIEAPLGDVPTGAGVKVSIWSTAATGLPSAKLHDLTNPATITANSLNTFTAPAYTALAAGTTYTIVFENTGTGSTNVYRLGFTDSNDEDSGAASGWSIADTRAFRQGTGNWSLSSLSAKPQIAIRGRDIAPPTLLQATVEGTKLTLLYSEPLDTRSKPATSAFTVTVGGSARTVSTVDVNGSEVTLTLSSAAMPTQPVTVSYTVPGFNAIRDGSSNKAAALSSRAVTVLVTAVANTGQTAASGSQTIGTAGAHSWQAAIAFTTGADALTLSEVEAQVVSVPASAGVQVSIWSTTAAGLPSAKLHTLTNPASFTPLGLNTFTAPANTTLDANTTYAVVFENTATGTANQYQLTQTDSNAEDAGAVPGWSLADKGANHSSGTNAWAVNSGANKVQVGIKGTVNDTTAPALSRATVEGTALRLVYSEALDTGSKPANGAFTVAAPGTNPTVTGVAVSGPAVTLTLSAAVTARPVTMSYTRGANPIRDWAGHDAANLANRAVTLVTELVANTAPAHDGAALFTHDLAQAFTTGSSAQGYVLTEVGLEFQDSGTVNPPHTLTIQGATASSGPDGTVLGTLTAPSSISTGVQIYTASGAGIALDPDTTYFVVVDSKENNTDFSVRHLAADTEDSGAAPGWSIGNADFSRAWDSTGSWTIRSTGFSMRIEVHGRANDITPPTFSRATVEGTKVVLHYSEALAEDRAPANTAFTVSVAGANRTVSTVAVSGTTVTLTLSGAAVTTGEVVTVSYTAPSANPLQDEAGNDAASFTSRSATHLVTMVSNTGRAVTSSTLAVGSTQHALAFTTGAGAVTLSEVVARLGDLERTPDAEVSVWSTDAAGLPSSKLYDLANPGAITANALNTFTAPANSTLDAGTTYAVVFGGDATTGEYDLIPTNSNDEDSGAATGWSIANNRAVRSGGSWSLVSASAKPLIAIRATTGPTLTGAAASGTTLTLTYDKALDSGSTPTATAFTVTVAGTARNVTRVVVSGTTVTLTFSGASVMGGQAVRLSYAVPTANPIQDPTGNDAARLTNRPVTFNGIAAIAFTNKPRGRYASVGGHIEVTVTFSEAATVTGTPRIRLAPALRGQTRYAGYVSGTGTKALVFRYTLVDGDNSGTTTVSIPANGLDRDGAANNATIKFGTTDAPAGHISVDSGKTAKVAQPTVDLAFGAPTFDHDLDGTNDTYVVNNSVKVKVRFTEPMTVNNGGSNSNVQIVVTIGSADHTLNFISASGADLEFGSRTVAAGDADTDGITIKRDGSNNLVRLSGTATIKSTANSNNAVLTASADLGVRAAAGAATPLVLVRGTNAVPTSSDFSKTAHRNVDLALAVRDFPITDADGDPLKEMQVVTLPDSTHGTLALDGTAIASSALPKTVTRAELSGGDLVFSPVEDFTSSATAIPTFTFKVVDSFGAAAASANTATINVVVPPAPSFGGGGGGDDGPSPSTIDFEWTVKDDIESLHAGHTAATGMWGAGGTVWIAQNGPGAADGVYAYDRESGERLAGREFALAARNRAPRGSWSDGTTMWVADSGRDRLFAYDLKSGERVEARDIALSSRNSAARGIWGSGTALWVLNANPSLFVYDRASGALLAEYALHARNRDPRGLWSDGVTLWVSDHGAKMLFAYRLPALPAAGADAPEKPPALERVPAEEFTHLSSSSNLSPRGLWSDGAVMYVADALDRRVYTYNMPDAIDARLASLALSGVEIGAFDAARAEYDGVIGAGVTETTVAAEAAQPGAAVAIEPPDADAAADGHQVALAGTEAIAVTVTSGDGSRTRVYRVALPPRPCLSGAVAVGFSLAVYEGGSVDALDACARDRAVTALYALHAGAYVTYIPDAPAIVNRRFRDLFADGVPALTPLVVASDGPASADPAAADAGPPWPACLRGAVGAGFSAVVYEGGSIEDLAACARGRDVTALYVLHEGGWVPYAVGGPAIVNRRFHELFPDGVPAVTPFLVRSEGAATAAGR